MRINSLMRVVVCGFFGVLSIADAKASFTLNHLTGFTNDPNNQYQISDIETYTNADLDFILASAAQNEPFHFQQASVDGLFTTVDFLLSVGNEHMVALYIEKLEPFFESLESSLKSLVKSKFTKYSDRIPKFDQFAKMVDRVIPIEGFSIGDLETNNQVPNADNVYEFCNAFEDLGTIAEVKSFIFDNLQQASSFNEEDSRTLRGRIIVKIRSLQNEPLEANDDLFEIISKLHQG